MSIRKCRSVNGESRFEGCGAWPKGQKEKSLSTRILQIIPADGWRAILVDPSGTPIDERLAAWALVEDDEDGAPEGHYRYLAGLATGEMPGVVSVPEDFGNFAFYVPAGERVTQEDVAPIAKARASRAEGKEQETFEHFDAIVRRKQRAIEILSRKWPDCTEGKAGAIQRLSLEIEVAAKRTRDIRERKRWHREAHASCALMDRAEALAATELAGAEEPAKSEESAR